MPKFYGEETRDSIQAALTKPGVAMGIDCLPENSYTACVNSLRQHRAAILVQIALLIYFELCVFVPLGRWNDQPGNSAPFSSSNIILGAAVGGAQLLLLVGTIFWLRPLLWLGLAGDTIWLLLHIKGLWIPYFFGASPQYARMHERVFGRTTKLLPNFGDHLAPDAMHIFIDVFLVAVIVTLVMYLRNQKVSSPSASR